MMGLAIVGIGVAALFLVGFSRQKRVAETASFASLMFEANNAFLREDRAVFCEALAEAQSQLNPAAGPSATMPQNLLTQYQMGVAFQQSGIQTDQLLSIASLLQSQGYDYEAGQLLRIAQEIHC